MSGRRTPPAVPGDKPREYPHGSGDRNRASPVGQDRAHVFTGGRQRVAPTDVGPTDGSNGPRKSAT